MRRSPTALTLIGVLVVGSFSAAIYKYHTDKTAWEQVQASLVRLRSGLQFESIIALRSHLADADTALKLYKSEWRTYPPDRAERVRHAEKSLSYINSALDWKTQSGSREDTTVDQAHVRALETLPDVTVNLGRGCAGGLIQISAASASAAFALAGISLLEGSEYPPASDAHVSQAGQLPPLDFEKETRECQRQETSRKENETKQYWAQFRYRVGLSLRSPAPGTCVFYLSIDRVSKMVNHAGSLDQVELYPGRTREFGMNRDANILDTNCYEGMNPEAFIVTTVNGKTYTPKWTARNAMISPK
jgi:hypothetical protein